MAENDSEAGEWDETWVGICEMPVGPESGFEEFSERVRAKMKELGNDVERPLVMKVNVKVHPGELSRPDDRQD